MTYRGHIQNGAVVLDLPTQLPEGAAVEVSVITASSEPPLSVITSIEQLRDREFDGAFGDEFEETIQKWRNEPWRISPQEPLE